MMLYILLIALWSICQVCAQAITQAVCKGEFNWMDNTNHVSPCDIASQLQGICTTGRTTVPPLNGHESYNVSVPNSCKCSWVAYNLLSGCTVCQGYSNLVISWTSYSTLCTSADLQSQPFPSYQIPAGFAVPFWAAQDPSSWPEKVFDETSAHQLASEGHADVSSFGAPVEANSSKPIGAIAGGVVGGLVGLGLLIGLGFLLRCRAMRHKKSRLADSHQQGHGRNASIASQKTIGSGGGTLLHYGSQPSLHSSAHSLPYSNGMVMAPSPPPGHPIGTTSLVSNVTNPENVVTPFTLQPLHAHSVPARDRATVATDRKRADGSMVPVDAVLPSSTARTTPNSNVATQATHSGQRPRYNPPAYTPSPDQTPEPQIPVRSRYGHSKTKSAETHSSFDSSRSGHSRTTSGETVVTATISGVMAQLDEVNTSQRAPRM